MKRVVLAQTEIKEPTAKAYLFSFICFIRIDKFDEIHTLRDVIINRKEWENQGGE